MKVCTPEYFKKFECINSECTDTCCKHWRVEIDKSTYAKYDKAIKNSNSLGITVKKHIRKRKNVYFKNCTDGSCPFLNEKKLCSLHIDFGYDILPHTCKAYPRFYNSFGLYEEAGLSFSCPAAAEIICAGDDDLKVIDDNRCIEVYTDVDAQLFYAVKYARDEIYKFLSNSNLNLNSKIFIILEYADSVQKVIDNIIITRNGDNPVTNKDIILRADAYDDVICTYDKLITSLPDEAGMYYFRCKKSRTLYKEAIKERKING